MRVHNCRTVGRFCRQAGQFSLASTCIFMLCVLAAGHCHGIAATSPCHACSGMLALSASLPSCLLFAGGAHCGPRHAAPQVGAPAGRSGGQGAAVQWLSCGIGYSGQESTICPCAVVCDLTLSVYSSSQVVQAVLWSDDSILDSCQAVQVVLAPPELHWQTLREPGNDGSLSGGYGWLPMIWLVMC